MYAEAETVPEEMMDATIMLCFQTDTFATIVVYRPR